MAIRPRAGMTTAPSPPPVSVPTFPAVFDGIGALVVDSSAADPEVLVDTINRHSGDGALTWVAAKLTGADTGGADAVRHALGVWRDLGLKVGGWIYCDGPPVDDVQSWIEWLPLDFVIYDVESPYKSDEGGHYEWAADLTGWHWQTVHNPPAAVTSYGGYKSSIDFAAFARAGWPVFAQAYDAFTIEDVMSYWQRGPYPREGVHALVRSLQLTPRLAVYRPEGIDE